MASIIKRQGKRGRFCYYVKFIDANRRQKMVKGYTDLLETQRLARKLEDEVHRLRTGDIDPQNEARKIERARGVSEHLKQYKTALEAAGRADNHVSYTVADVEKFIAHSGVTHATAVTRPQVDAWAMSLKTAGVDSHRTINRRVGSVQAFLRWLHEQKVLTDYVLLRYPKLGTKGHEVRHVRALSADEVETLLGIASSRTNLYKFVVKTGARYSAVAELEAQHIDLSAKQITLKRKTKGKVKGSPTYHVPMHPDLLPMLTRLTAGKKPDHLIFADVLPCKSQAARTVRADADAAGVKNMKGVGFHALRHTFVTLLARALVHPNVVKELADHQQIETTLNYYTHFGRQDAVAAVALL